jgi:hypothetical protein
MESMAIFVSGIVIGSVATMLILFAIACLCIKKENK